jgi:hypothetical protein
MILKAVGLPPRGRFSDMAARLFWRLLQYRQRRYARQTADPAPVASVPLPRAGN